MNLVASLGTRRFVDVEPDPPTATMQAAEAPPPKSPSQHEMAGYGHMRTIMAFMRWAHEQDRFPTVEATITRFGVCRATAYRWTSALAETYGLAPETRHTGRKA